MASIIDKLLDWKGVNDIGMVSIRDLANMLGINPATATNAEKKRLDKGKKQLQKAKSNMTDEQRETQMAGPEKRRKARGGKYIALIPGGPADPKLRVRQEAEDEYGSKEEKTAKKRGDNKTRKQSRAKQNIEAKSAKKAKTRKQSRAKQNIEAKPVPKRKSSPGEAPIARRLDTGGESPPARTLKEPKDIQWADGKKKKDKRRKTDLSKVKPPRKPVKKSKDLQWGEFPERKDKTADDLTWGKAKDMDPTRSDAKKASQDKVRKKSPKVKKKSPKVDSKIKQLEDAKPMKRQSGEGTGKDPKYKYYGKKGSLLGDISRALEIKYDTNPEERASGGMIGASDMSAKKTSAPKKKKMPQYYMGGGPIKKGKKYANGGRVAKYNKKG